MLRKQLLMKMRITSAVILLIAGVAATHAVAQTYTVVHTFTGGSDGTNPNQMIRDAQGNLYGTTYAGGASACNGHDGACGTVFKIDPAGNETVLFTFPGGNGGSSPLAAVTEDAAGNLYGTTEGDGFLGASVIYKLAPSGKEISYVPPSGGSLDSSVVLDKQGNIYGMDPFGGVPNCGWNRNELGCGTLFRLTPQGKFTTIHTFSGTDGMQPEGGMVMDAQGNLYGTAFAGGIRTCLTTGYGDQDSPGCGEIFKLDTHGKFTVLHIFTGEGDGGGPLGLIIDSKGNLYGIAQNGGYDTGNIYGLGTVFKVDTSGKFSVLFTFMPPETRSAGYANHLVRDAKGNLYGAKQYDGAHNTGFLFRLDTAGNFTDLYDFDEQSNGFNMGGFIPTGLVLGSDDDIYGTMFMGGDAGLGTVFHITP
jgi:uncharacterized repeat protein (TIGR03803 family)